MLIMKARLLHFLIPSIFILFNVGTVAATTYEVGPTKTYTVPSQVAGLVNNGDTVAIDGGTYIGDVAAWYADDLVLMGVGGRAHLRANGNNAQGKAIWVIAGNNTQVINIEFSECTVPDQNGAGIRQEGTHLTIRNCYFHNNENGILTTNDANSNIVVEHSEFAYNGNGLGTAHNIYINKVRSFTLRYCYMHHAAIGHNVKSRAYQNLILYNRIMDENTGNSSMLVDLSNGGESAVIGNLFHQGANAENKRSLTYGVEGLSNPSKELYVINNTFVNDRFNGEFVVVQAGATAVLTNNVFAGAGTVLIGTASQTTNVNILDPTTLNFTDLANFDYGLTSSSTALIDQGSAPGFASNGISLAPIHSYLHPLQYTNRPPEGTIDVGAYEYFSTPPTSNLFITISGDNPLCPGDSATLYIPDAYTAIQWSTGQQGINSITVYEPGIYAVTATDGTGTETACKVITLNDDCTIVPNKVTITETEGLSTNNFPVQLARPFRKGELLDVPQVLIDGNAVLTQAKVQTRWEDGSVKHAILNFLIPQLLANQSVQITFQNQSPPQPTIVLTQAQMLSADYNFDAVIELENGGNTVTASARDMLANGDFEYWLQGEVATSILLGDHALSRLYDMGFDEERSFRPLFYATFWHQTQQVDIRYVGEISNSEHLQDMNFALELFIGASSPASVYTKSSFTHHALSRWTKRFWLGGTPAKVNIDHGLPYLVETMLIPNYDTTKIVSDPVIDNHYQTAYYAWLQQARDINEDGNWTQYMPTTGGRDEIGPYPAWLVRWLYTGDWRMLEQSAGNADLAGAWPMHIREGKATKYYDRNNTTLGLGKPISVSDRPTFWFGNLDFTYTNTDDRVIPVGIMTNGGWTPDNAHQPDPYSLLYMLTGEYWYWEQLNFWTSFGAANSNGAFTTGVWGRGPTGKEGGIPGQIRGLAWLFRTRVRTAMLAPDGSPEKNHFTTLTDDAIAIWEGQHNITNTKHYQSANWNWGYNILGGNDPSPLYHWHKGNLGTAQSSCLDLNTTCWAVAPWQYNMLLFSLGRGEALGFDSELLRQWVGRHVVDVLTHPDYDPYLIANYREPSTQQTNCDWFTSWSDMKNAYGPTCDDPITIFNNYKNDTNHGYTNIALTATSFVTDLENGENAWGFMSSCLDNPLLNDDPKWAIQPALYPSILQMTELACGDVISGDTRPLSNQLFTMPSCSDFVDNGSAGIWYYISGTGDSITLSTCSSNTNFDTQLAVFDDCSSFNCVAANNDAPSCTTNGAFSSLTFATAENKDYYIFVSGREVTDKGRFELSVECMGCTSNTTIWKGTINNDWNEPGNWDCGVPNTSKFAIIPGGTPTCILSNGQMGGCYTLAVEQGAVLTVEQGAALDVVVE